MQVNPLLLLQGFQFIEGSRPIGAEQAREASISQDFSAGLAAGAIVGFIIGVSDTQNLLATSRTRFAVAAVYRHVIAEGGYLFGKFCFCLGPKAIDPQLQSLARGGEQALPFVGLELVCKRDR